VRQVDDAILSCYLAGANSRRLRKALEPLLGGEHLSKSAVSRVVARLKEHFAAWTSRDLSDELYSIIYLDGFHLKVRMARRVVSVPVLAVLGVVIDANIQRCTQHKRQNRLDHCPVHARPELKRDYQRIVFAAYGMEARGAYKEVLEKWQQLCPPVARSLEEGGSELLTFYAFPKALQIRFRRIDGWKAMRQPAAHAVSA
jgi:transposase-like protein